MATAAIDYEKEYDNRGRIPEHPEIFARWASETEAYRKAAAGAQLGLKYGPSPRQSVDFFPAKEANAPLAMFIHGGWWRTLDPSMFSQMAKGPNGNGVSVAVVGYDLCPQVSIATIIEQMRAACLYLWRQHKKRIFVYGHSAGGHLGRLHGGDRLEDACRRRARRSRSVRLYDLRRVRPDAAAARVAKRRPETGPKNPRMIARRSPGACRRDVRSIRWWAASSSS